MADAARRNEGGLTRRCFIGAVVGGVAVLAAPRLGHAVPPAFSQAASQSSLVYVSPLLANGAESSCHGEVWFVVDGSDLLVVTTRTRWRAAAVARGRTRARIWVGEHGLWTSANEGWKESPSVDASARFDEDKQVRARALALYGGKYTDEWSKWGPRFDQGLASGERVIIRYTPDAS